MADPILVLSEGHGLSVKITSVIYENMDQDFDETHITNFPPWL